MSRFLCPVVFILLSAASSAQTGRWLDGSVVVGSGETLHGFIKNVAYENRSEQVTFRTSRQAEPVVYSPEEVSAYHIGTTEHYIRGRVRIGGEGIDRLLFVRQIVSGTASLYRLDYRIFPEDNPLIDYQTTFYFLSAGRDSLDELTELSYRKTLADALGNDCVIREGLYTNFNDAGLSNLVSTYNTCNGSASEIYITPDVRERTWRFGVAAGGIQTQIRSDFSAFDNAPLEEDFGLAISAFMDFPAGRHFVVRSGLAYVQKSSEGMRKHVVNENYDNFGEELTLKSAMKLNQILIPLSLAYRWSDPAFQPFVRAGGYAGFGIKGSASADRLNFRPENGLNIQFVEHRENIIADLTGVELGWLAGTGLAYKVSDQSTLFFEFQVTGGRSVQVKSSPNYQTNTTYGVHVGWWF